VSTGLRLRRSRRSRSLARSSHHRGHVRRVLNHKSGRRWRAPVRLGKRSKRFSAGKETKEGKRRYRQHKAYRQRPAPAPHPCAPDVITAISSKGSEESCDYLSLKLDDPPSARPLSLSSTGRWRRIIADALRLKELVEDHSWPLCPNQAGGSR
jgi:hypothetical protein